jgi:4-amino-4-deoxy-L-arabinose transferase-like glycosyltransferase
MPETSISSIVKKINPYLLFFLLCVALYLPSSFWRTPFAPDEFRNLYIAHNIQSSADYLFPKYVDGFYHEKPPFYFWILKAFLKIQCANPLVLPILFNAIVSSAILSLNYFLLKKEGCERVGFLSSLVLASCGIFYGMNMLVRMDILFLFFIFLSICSFWFACRYNKTALFLLAPILSFFAVFTKGAFGIIFPLFIEIGIAIILKSKKAFVKAIGINLLAALFVFTWLFSFSQLRSDYFFMMFFRQTVARGVNPMSHAEPLYYYCMFLIPLFLPWSLLLIGYGLNFKKSKLYLWEKMHLLWFIVGFLVLSLIRSKLEMYLLLLSIPFCGLLGKFISQGSPVVKKRIFVFTSAFFFLSCLIAYCIFRNKSGMPASAIFSIPLFLTMALFAIKKSPEKQFKYFFIFWLLFIQMLNLLYLPSTSAASPFKKIMDTVTTFKKPFTSIYVTEKSLLTLTIYDLKKPLRYAENKEAACRINSSIIISKEQDFPCPTQKIAKFKEFSLFYKP